jgi:hypothetical protein
LAGTGKGGTDRQVKYGFEGAEPVFQEVVEENGMDELFS